MRVIVYAEDLSGRRDDGHYTKPDLGSALDILFAPGVGINSLDEDGDDKLSREDAEAMFATDGRIAFFNPDGERVVISADPSA